MSLETHQSKWNQIRRFELHWVVKLVFFTCLHSFLQPRIGPFPWGQTQGWFARIGWNLESWIPAIWEGLQVLRKFGGTGCKTSSPLATNQFHPSWGKSPIAKRVANPRGPWAICRPSLECYVSQVQLDILDLKQEQDHGGGCQKPHFCTVLHKVWLNFFYTEC